MAKLSTKTVAYTIVGGYIHIILPDGSGGWDSRRILLSDFVGDSNVHSFTDLDDVINTYTGNQFKILRVNAEETELEAVDPELIFAGMIHNADEKTTPVDADELGLWDSVVGLVKRLTWANLKATLKAYFDTLFIKIDGTNSDIDYLDFDLTPATAVNAPGRLWWDVDNETLTVGLPDGGSFQLGEELADYYTASGFTPTEGDIVSIITGTGNQNFVQLTDATDQTSSFACIGMITAIHDTSHVRVTKLGKVHDLNTSAYDEGQVIYVDPLNPGKWSITRPVAPNHTVIIGVVSVKHLSVGIVNVNPRIIVNDADVLSLVTDNILTTNLQSDKAEIDKLILGFTTQATAGGTTTLTVTSKHTQEFTGTLDEIISMPVVSTLTTGREFVLINTSTGTLTVNSSGGNLITTIAAGQTAILKCVLITGTGASSWSVFSGGGGGGKTISKDNTFTGSIDFDVDEKYYSLYTQTGTLDIFCTNTNGADSWAYLPIATNGMNINFPANWTLQGGNEYEYNRSSARFDLYVWTNGTDYFYRFIKANELAETNPELLYAKIFNSDTDAIKLTFNRPVNITTTSWTIATDGAALSISSVSGSGTHYPIFALSRAVLGWETITLTYDGDTGETEDLNANPLLDITDFSVYNRVDIDLNSELGALLLRWYKDSRLSANRIDDTTGGTTTCNEWVDASANLSNVVQTTKANQPLVTATGLKFDGVSDFMIDTLSLGACEIFFVQKFHTATVANRLLMATQGTNRILLRNTATPGSYTLYGYGSGTSISSGTLQWYDFNILRIIVDGASSKFNENTGNLGTAMATTTFTVGADNGSAFSADYAIELIITERLTDAQRNKVVKRLTQISND